MKYRFLARGGLRVSEVALGTMTFGDEWGMGSRRLKAQKVYETYPRQGGNFIDNCELLHQRYERKIPWRVHSGRSPERCLSHENTPTCAGNESNAAGNHRKSMRKQWKPV